MALQMEKMQIMLVDDEERFLSTTKALLLKNGYEILTASSGPNALDLLEQNSIHVVLLDVMMPGMDGISTLKEIRKHFPLVEVIMLIGHGDEESALEGLKCGAADYIMKPTSVGELVKKAEEAFEKRQRLEEKIRMAQTRKFK